MSTSNPDQLQDRFLNIVRKERVPVSVFLANGIQLKGKITSFDKYSLILNSNGNNQLVYKHCISTVVPQTTVNLSPITGGEETEKAA